jgi:coenzyme F420 hydrogenase subunit beta
MPFDNPITRAVACNLCTGCGACAGIAPDFISMVEDPVNGRRPVVQPTDAGRAAATDAAKVCAGLGSDHGTLPRVDALDRTWGPVRAAWIGYAADPAIRHKGSSGGAITALALFALQSGEVGAVAHTIADETDPRRTRAALSRDRDQLMRGAGSRYAQASPAEVLADLADDKTLFIGKPCDVASVAKACETVPGLAAKLPLTMAIFCAGAPNLQAADQLLARLGKPEEAKLTALRYRGEGWPGLMQARWQQDGAEVTSVGIPYGEGWGRILQAHRRWRCRVCTDHTGAFADISVGDPWHKAPEGNEDAGKSLIIARSPAGEALIRAAIAAGVLVASDAPRDAIAQSQPNLLASLGAVWGRRLAMRLAALPVPDDRGLPLFRAWLALSTKEKAQSVGGTLRRILRLRLWRPVVIGADVK